MKPKVIQIFFENNDFQYVETLRRNREKRQKSKEFFVEGVRAINEALKYHWKIRAFLYAQEKPLSDWANHILRSSEATTHFELPLPLLQKLSIKSGTSELLAIISMPEDNLSRIPVKHGLLIVIFDRPTSHGNLGTIIRSCDALAVDGLIVTGHVVDLYDPETIRATTGSFFALPTVRLPSHNELLPWFDLLRQKIGPFSIVGSHEKAGKNLSAHDFTQAKVLVVGNETWGMSASYHNLCDSLVKIPMYGSASSLNVACATSILLYEIDRQRKTHDGQSDAIQDKE